MKKVKKQKIKSPYSYALVIPIAVIFTIFFIIPTLVSFFFSMTRWTLFDWHFVGFENFVQYFKEASLAIGFKNTLIYGVVTSGLKVVFAISRLFSGAGFNNRCWLHIQYFNGPQLRCDK